jgi:hypothetical protein
MPPRVNLTQLHLSVLRLNDSLLSQLIMSYFETWPHRLGTNPALMYSVFRPQFALGLKNSISGRLLLG